MKIRLARKIVNREIDRWVKPCRKARYKLGTVSVAADRAMKHWRWKK